MPRPVSLKRFLTKTPWCFQPPHTYHTTPSTVFLRFFLQRFNVSASFSRPRPNPQAPWQHSKAIHIIYFYGSQRSAEFQWPLLQVYGREGTNDTQAYKTTPGNYQSSSHVFTWYRERVPLPPRSGNYAWKYSIGFPGFFMLEIPPRSCLKLHLEMISRVHVFLKHRGIAERASHCNQDHETSPGNDQ